VADKSAELFDRRSGEKQDVSLDKAVGLLVELVEQGRGPV
jgi:hypothetical protein